MLLVALKPTNEIISNYYFTCNYYFIIIVAVVIRFIIITILLTFSINLSLIIFSYIDNNNCKIAFPVLCYEVSKLGPWIAQTQIVKSIPWPYLTFIVGTLVQSSQGMHQIKSTGAFWLCPNGPECRYNDRVLPTQVR